MSGLSESESESDAFFCLQMHSAVWCADGFEVNYKGTSLLSDSIPYMCNGMALGSKVIAHTIRALEIAFSKKPPLAATV